MSEIVKMVYEATNSKMPIARIADKISGIFVPSIMIIAVLSFIVNLCIFKEFSQSINTFVSVLVVACPCSLGLATPLSIVIASMIASKNGIVIKRGEVLETASNIKTAIFDKTGTLTKGQLTVSKIYSYTKKDENDILKIIASIEKNSSHPIAKAILKFAKEENVDLEQIMNFEEISGYGVSAIYLDSKYYIGNRKLLEKNDIKIDEKVESDLKELLEEENSIVFLASDKEILALLGVKDVIKENAKEVVIKLKECGINTVMLTGDNEKTAKIVADKIGIDEVFANVTPKNKAEKIKEYKEKGITLMCGDGINDSASLTYADIGVSFFNGTDIAANSSNVILMNDNLEKILTIISLSKKTIKNIKENLFWAFIYNICMIPIAMGVFSKVGIALNPMIASFAMTLSSLTVVLNSLRLRKINLKNVNKK